MGEKYLPGDEGGKQSVRHYKTGQPDFKVRDFRLRSTTLWLRTAANTKFSKMCEIFLVQLFECCPFNVKKKAL